MQKIQIYEEEEQLFKKAAALFLTLAERAIQQHKKLYLALSGGGTPDQLYANLVLQKDLLSWQDVEVYFSDERLVPITDTGSNYYQASKQLLDQVGHPKEKRFFPDASLSHEEAAVKYEELIRQQVPNKEGIPCFDIILLGLGNDGHTASLFPHQIGNEIFESLVVPVTAKYKNRPSKRISMTPKIINRAANVIFLLEGHEKAQAVYHSLMEGQDWHIWPASSITGHKNDVYWFMNEAAAEHLEIPITVKPTVEEKSEPAD
jgi:6-phosphogluconolactonase